MFPLKVLLLALAVLILGFAFAVYRGGPDLVAAGSCSALPPTYPPTLQATIQPTPPVVSGVQGVRTDGNQLDITLSNQWTTQDCGDGKDVNISGFGNYITLIGSCNQVAVNGWDNTVHIAETAWIDVTGDSNTLIWNLGRNVPEPAMQIEGMYNSVRHLATPGSRQSLYAASVHGVMTRVAKFRHSVNSHALPNNPEARPSYK
jgi:hypothetical protein